MTCKDCIHEKVCDALIKSGCPYLDEEVPADEFCMEFRNAADVVPKSEVARKICCEIEEEIVAALESNYRVLKEYDDGRCNDYILEIVNRVQGKIDALRGIEGFVEELKKKYTEEHK